MMSWLGLISLVLIQPAPPPAPLPLVEAKDLPPAARGPLAPQAPDAGAERGLTGALRRKARQSPGLPAVLLPDASVRVKDSIRDLSGWRAYAASVAPGEAVKVHVVAGRTGWFRVLGVNAWGTLEPGLLQNRIPTGEALATYLNPTQEVRTVYFIVDTLDANMVGEVFEFEFTRTSQAQDSAKGSAAAGGRRP